MSEPAVQLSAITEANDEMRGIAKQALEWVRVSEQRVAEAEARAEKTQAELKERAKETLQKIGAEGRERLTAEREKRVEAVNRASRPRRPATAPRNPLPRRASVKKPTARRWPRS